MAAATFRAVGVLPILFLFYFAPFVSSDDFEKCTQINKCRCQFANGTGIDLSGSETATFYEASIAVDVPHDGFNVNSYYFHPCSNTLFKQAILKPNVTNQCQNVSICEKYTQYRYIPNNSTVVTIHFESNYLPTGNVENAVIQNTGEHFLIVYTYEADTVTVKLTCINDKNQLTILNPGPKDAVLNFYSKDACIRRLEPEHHRSLGTTLLIIFFVLAIVYLILGVCTKKFLMGAQGIEVIPNLSFWTDLPGLIKDGLNFVKNGFRVAPVGVSASGQSPNPHSYDSI